MSLLWVCIGLVLVFEGLMPFLAPRYWRLLMHRMMMQSDQALRTTGLISMLLGLILIYLFR